MQDVTSDSFAAIPAILFGAFDRHNLGDLLFPHIAAALIAEKNIVFAGLVERDLRPLGGHRVEALADLALQWCDHPVTLIHAGGELLTCDTWQAAIMTLPQDEVLDTLKRFDGHPREALAWAQDRIGLHALAPYTVPRALFPHARAIVYNGVGGVDLDEWAPEYRAEVLAKLQEADAVGVRDRRTQAHLHAAGLRARLMPDPAVMVAELFGEDIHRRGSEGETARIRNAFPQGYIAVQFSTEFGDDATLTMIAAQLDELARATGLGIVFFRAGAAPWHDDLGCFERVAARMHNTVTIFTSLDVWDICALIAASKGYLGSSLHGRIVAMAFALPRLNLVHSSQPGKQVAFASTWEDPQMTHTVQASRIARGMQEMLAIDARALQHQAGELAARYRQEFTALCADYISFANT